MRFRLLGPIEVTDHDRVLPLGGTKQRSLLALLLLDANEIVSTDRLIAELWADAPPATVAKSIQAYVSRLRAELGSDRLITRSPGYAVRVDPGELDVEVFERLCEEARRAPPEIAAEKLREALSLWRGPPLGDLRYESFAQAEIARLEELRAVRARAAHRRRLGSGPPCRPDRRAAAAGGRPPAPRAPAWPADARAVPVRTPGGCPPRLSGRAPPALRGARPATRRGAQAARAGDPGAGPRARPAGAGRRAVLARDSHAGAVVAHRPGGARRARARSSASPYRSRASSLRARSSSAASSRRPSCVPRLRPSRQRATGSGPGGSPCARQPSRHRTPAPT